jgi:hypothetical protein
VFELKVYAPGVPALLFVNAAHKMIGERGCRELVTRALRGTVMITSGPRRDQAACRLSLADTAVPVFAKGRTNYVSRWRLAILHPTGGFARNPDRRFDLDSV